MANERPVILVADGEDTAKDMYLRQGYIYPISIKKKIFNRITSSDNLMDY